MARAVLRSWSARARRSLTRAAPVLALAVIVACGSDTPRDSHVVLMHGARRAVVTGVAGGTRPTLDLAPGCGGFVDDGPPDQLVDVKQAMKLDFVARSTRGPVALVVVGDDGALCDGDGGTGHAPRIHVVAPGRYRVWVASMHQGEHLPYELTIAPPSKEEETPLVAAGGGPTGGSISVTVTSTPAGAEVRSTTGQVLGQTPAMFEYPAQPGAAALAFVVDAPGRQPATVSGTPIHGELVLNAVLGGGGMVAVGGSPTAPSLAGATTLTAATPVRIRDYTTSTQTIAWPAQCTIANMSVETVIHHTCLSDLRVRLTSPTGTVVTLHDHTYRNSLSRTWTTTDAHGAIGRLVGQEAQGTWTMTVRDDVDADSGTFESFTLHIACAGDPAAAPTGMTAVDDVDRTMPPLMGIGLNGGLVPMARAPRSAPGSPPGEINDPWR